MKKVKDVTVIPRRRRRSAIVTCPPSRDAYPAEIFPAEEDGSGRGTEGAVEAEVQSEDGRQTERRNEKDPSRGASSGMRGGEKGRFLTNQGVTVIYITVMRAKTFTNAEGAVYLLGSASLLKVRGRPTIREGVGGGKG